MDIEPPSSPFPSSPRPLYDVPRPNNNNISLDLATIFQTDIKKAAQSYIKITFSINNLKDINHQNNQIISNQTWPPHIRGKIKSLDITIQPAQVKRGYPKNLLNNIFSQELFRQIPIEWSQLTPIQKEEIFNFAIHLSNQLRILQFLNTLFKSFAARFNLDFNNNIKIRIALKSNPNILQLTTCSKLSREKVALVSERLSQ